MRRVVFLLLGTLILGCPQTDDDDTVDDDDTAVDDDDSGDDDDTTGDDDDDTTGDDDDTTAPTTTLELLGPSDSAILDGFMTVTVAVDGDGPGILEVRLDSELVHQGFASVATGQLTKTLDTGAWPDGTYTLTASAPAWDLEDSVSITLANGDLLEYDLGTVTYEWLPANPTPLPLTLFDSAVSLQPMTWAADSAPYQALAGFALNPDGDWAVGGATTSIYLTGAAGAAPWAASIPNHPNVPWLTGSYNLYPWADEGMDGEDLSVTAVVKRSFAPVEAGLLHLDFYFVSGVAETAASAPGSSNMQGFLDALESVYLQANLGLGDVRYFDLPAGSFLNIDDYDELTELFAQAPSTNDRVLNVFVVEDLDMPSSNPLGVASHIPGPSLVNGSRQSGVAIVDQYIQSGESGTAAALAAHEIGHYLGLTHSSEIGGNTHDQLDDTVTSCNSGGCWETNLMDPYLYGSTAITPDQGWVLLRHPLVELVPASSLPARSARWFDGADGLDGPVIGFCGTGAP